MTHILVWEMIRDPTQKDSWADEFMAFDKKILFP